ncbi:phosphatidylglycerophosphatase A family protein [Levilactobacillus bambusae]|uniref:Phosphatidylglycerophosphatase A n=1 Tax=Levilactobacillus bambusae TaxID=2024736 RepID=A0A2V1MZU6_9LACO|nr:phosphatidylglycerophosphatase A [Levilactobacillus bambusae]PWF99619.1 phosphatidylglycerophosphatase A [Levilactobacillus bambusae]
MTKPDTRLRERTIELLKERGVSLTDIGELVIFLQKDYIKGLTMDMAIDSVQAVLSKREVQNAVITGIQLDVSAEKNQLLQPLQTIIERDEGLYGVDETMALSIVNVYGSIGFTNYGYIDKVKPGILTKLNAHKPGEIHTFLDDLVGAVAAAAASRLAHADPKEQDDPYR